MENWVSKNPRNFGSDKISVIPYVRPPLHVSRGEILHFKHPCVLAINCMATRTFREKKQSKAESFFFRLNFNVYNDVDNRERARTRDKKNRGDEEKHDNFISAVRRKEMLTATKEKMSGSKKKNEQEHIRHFLHKTCN